MRLTCRAESALSARVKQASIAALMSLTGPITAGEHSLPLLAALTQQSKVESKVCTITEREERSRWVSLAMEARAGRATVMAELAAAAARGSPLVQRLLGEVLLASADSALAHEGLLWLTQASASNGETCRMATINVPEQVLAMASLGRAYLVGSPHWARNPQVALPYLTQAGKHGIASSQLHLALAIEQTNAQLVLSGMAKRGNDTHTLTQTQTSQSKATNDEVHHWLHQAASNPVDPQPQAMFLLASRLRNDPSKGSNQALALYWYRQSAAVEYAPALQALAIAYLHGELGLPRNPSWGQQILKGVEHAVQHPAGRF